MTIICSGLARADERRIGSGVTEISLSKVGLTPSILISGSYANRARTHAKT